VTSFVVQTRNVVFEVSERLVQFGVPLQIGVIPISTVRFVLNGKISTVTRLDGAWIAPRPGVIRRITLWRGTAGNAGSTVADVNKNGVTIYTDQGNRPTVLASAGDDVIDATTDFDVPRFVQDDRIEVDVDASETGNSIDLTVVLEIAFDA
jgi:hypothetical protein